MVKLEDYNLTELRKIASQYNKKVKLPAYSKLKKSELISLLRNHPQLEIIEGGEKLKISVKSNDFEPDLKVSKKELNKKIKEKVDVKPTSDKKGVEIKRKDGRKHTKKEVEVLKKNMPDANVKVEGKKLVVKPKKEEPKKKEEPIKDIINEMIELYGKEGLKKKSNDFKNIEQLKKFSDTYFKKNQRVEDYLEDKDTSEWFEKNMSLTIGKKYFDTVKNFVRRMKPMIRELKKK